MSGPPSFPDPSALLAAEPTRRRRGLGWAVGLAVLVISLGYAWFRGGEGAADLDQHLLVVLPFQTAGADSTIGVWRERLPVLFAAELTDDGPIRTTPPEVTLAAWRGRGGNDSTDLTLDRALALAEDMGAGRLLLGRLAGEPRLVLMTTTLFTVPGGHIINESFVEGPADSIPFLVARLSTRLRFRW